MSSENTDRRLTPDTLRKALYPQLFAADGGFRTFALIDGASVKELLDHLYGDPRPDFVCLYRGELKPDMAEVAPYLVELIPETPFADWLLGEGWGKHWGVFVTAQSDLAALRKHFRTFTIVKDPDGKLLYFRFYDPRVLRVYLPTCNAQELATVFGPVQAYLLEDKDSAVLLRFSRAAGSGDLRGETVKLVSAAG